MKFPERTPDGFDKPVVIFTAGIGVLALLSMMRRPEEIAKIDSLNDSIHLYWPHFLPGCNEIIVTLWEEDEKLEVANAPAAPEKPDAPEEPSKPEPSDPSSPPPVMPPTKRRTPRFDQDAEFSLGHCSPSR